MQDKERDEELQNIQEEPSDQDAKEEPQEKEKPVIARKRIEKRVVLDDLTFVRVFDPIHIPRYLVEQIKERDFDVDKFYDYQKILCMFQTPEGPQLNPSNLLYVIVNEKLKQVKGFLWMAIDFLTDSLIVNNFSVDKEYWNRGEALTLLEKKSKSVMKDLNLKRIVWITKHGAFCEKLGYKRSKDAIMIYEPFQYFEPIKEVQNG